MEGGSKSRYSIMGISVHRLLGVVSEGGPVSGECYVRG